MREIAKKITANIEKEQAKLDALISKRDSFVAKLAEVNESIEKSEKAIAAYREEEKAAKLDAVASIIGKNGITVDDLLNAVANNDLYGIQEALENGRSSAESEAADETDTEESGESVSDTVSEDSLEQD